MGGIHIYLKPELEILAKKLKGQLSEICAKAIQDEFIISDDPDRLQKEIALLEAEVKEKTSRKEFLTLRLTKILTEKKTKEEEERIEREKREAKEKNKINELRKNFIEFSTDEGYSEVESEEMFKTWLPNQDLLGLVKFIQMYKESGNKMTAVNNFLKREIARKEREAEA